MLINSKTIKRYWLPVEDMTMDKNKLSVFLIHSFCLSCVRKNRLLIRAIESNLFYNKRIIRDIDGRLVSEEAKYLFTCKNGTKVYMKGSDIPKFVRNFQEWIFNYHIKGGYRNGNLVMI